MILNHLVQFNVMLSLEILYILLHLLGFSIRLCRIISRHEMDQKLKHDYFTHNALNAVIGYNEDFAVTTSVLICLSSCKTECNLVSDHFMYILYKFHFGLVYIVSFPLDSAVEITQAVLPQEEIAQ